MEFAIMDNKGIIEDSFNSEEEAVESIDRIRKELNQGEIKGDLKVIQILGVYN